jgi:hypothetical protein
VNLPNNMPPQMAQQVWNSVIQAAATQEGPVIDYKLIHVIIETLNHSESFITRGKIMGSRLPDLNYRIGTPKLSTGWEDNNTCPA